MWCFISNNFQFIINSIFSIFFIIIAWLGLSLWKKQLRGGDLYKYAKEALAELKRLLNLIEDYRYLFNSEEQEHIIWSKIQDQFSLYETKMIFVNILSKQKINDKINEKNIKDYLTIILKNRYEKYSIKYSEEHDEIPITERKDTSQRLIEIDKILKIRSGEDKFGDELNTYYESMRKKLEKYIK
jgi:hypothetical protein